MANNPHVNKVEYAGRTIIDLTNDTITSSNVLNGVTFHDRSGTPKTGSLITHSVYDGLDSSSTDDALSAKQGKILNDKLTTKSYSMTNIPSGVTLQNASIRKCANIVSGYIQVSKEVSIGGNIGSLSSSDIYPTTTYYFPCFNPNTSKYYGIITIGSSGEIRYYPNSTAAGTGIASIGANINYVI